MVLLVVRAQALMIFSPTNHLPRHGIMNMKRTVILHLESVHPLAWEICRLVKVHIRFLATFGSTQH